MFHSPISNYHKLFFLGWLLLLPRLLLRKHLEDQFSKAWIQSQKRKLASNHRSKCFLFFHQYCFSVSSNLEQCSPQLYEEHCFLLFLQKLIRSRFTKACTFLAGPALLIDIKMSSEYEVQDLLKFLSYEMQEKNHQKTQYSYELMGSELTNRKGQPNADLLQEFLLSWYLKKGCFL